MSSDEYWQARAGIGYHFNESVGLAVGYRIIGIDYEDGDLLYDAETKGPNVGLVFQF